MHILLVYPEYPDTFWGFKHAIKFINKKATVPPLSLLTVSSLLPASWEKKLVDMNIEKLKDKDLLWADYVFVSAMSVQLASVKEVISRCREKDIKIVAGGPLFTEEPEEFPEIDHLVLNEAEVTLPGFISDLEQNKAARVYESDQYPDIRNSVVPDYSLVKMKKYASLCIQYSRGCPYDCEFCDITALYGRKVRVKTSEQIIAELNNIYDTGYRGSIFIVDDNFIGNKHILKKQLLPAVIEWMDVRGNPFNFTTEASIDLSDDPLLMSLMVKAGFINVFVGIETPEEESLQGCNKLQNSKRNLIESVDIIQRAGIEVKAGFIVGFDQDKPNIFQRQIDFIQESGIITAMVGLLNAPKKTRLYERLEKEGRINDSFGGDNTNYNMNFEPSMDKQKLLSGYQNIIDGIYSNKPFYKRVSGFLKKFNPQNTNKTSVSFGEFVACLKSMVILGVFDNFRFYYWRLFFWSLFNKPKTLPLAITYSIHGYHFRKVFKGR